MLFSSCPLFTFSIHNDNTKIQILLQRVGRSAGERAHHQSLPSRAEPQAPTKMEGEKHLPQVLCCPPCVCKASTSPQDTPSTQIIKFIRLQGYSVSYDGWGVCLGAWEDTVFPQAPVWPHISFRPTLPLCNWSSYLTYEKAPGMPTSVSDLLTTSADRSEPSTWALTVPFLTGGVVSTVPEL